MTTRTISLSSNSTSTIINVPTVYMYDTCELIVSTIDIYTEKPITSLTFRWGDGSDDEHYVNDFFAETTDVIKGITFGYDYNIITDYYHQYSPSNIALTKVLSAQVLANYYDDTSCRFVIPIDITNPSLINKVGDLNLLSIASVDPITDEYLLTLHAKNGGYIVDTVFSVES
jgi:hypothetical protein